MHEKIVRVVSRGTLIRMLQEMRNGAISMLGGGHPLDFKPGEYNYRQLTNVLETLIHRGPETFTLPYMHYATAEDEDAWHEDNQQRSYERMREHREAILQKSCPKCNAAPGETCRSKSGVAIGYHMARERA